MGRWLGRTILLGALAAPAACIEVAPHASMPFHQARERHARYAAEVTLAIKEQRRDEATEAALNGRLVMPQMPEIWGITPGELQAATAAGPPVGLLDPAPGPRLHDPMRPGCTGGPGDCEAPLEIAGLAPGLLLADAIAPAAAPAGTSPGTPAALYRFNLYFGLDSAALDEVAQRVVEGAAGRALMARPGRIIVAGYADRSGVDSYNERLAQRRAAAVVSALIRAGVPAELIEAAALGERAPAVRTADGVAHRHNRRVEITLG